MVAVSVKSFGGMIPAIDDRLLPDTAAALSQDAWTYAGTVFGFPEVKELHSLVNPAAVTVYRIPELYENAAYLYGSTWLEFENPDTDVIRALVFDDEFDRYYWASSSGAPKYNTRARIENSDAEWLLGVPTPASITVTPTGGVGASTTRAYGITRVSAYGEEGAMLASDATVGKVDDTWGITFPAVAASDDGGAGDDRYLTHTNIYRTVVGTSGVATYFFVAQVAYSATSYNDTASDDTVAANAQLESQFWTPPPDDLEGWVVMSNGIVAGWRNTEVWFSEPYRPHAWPVSYVLTVEFPIVGLGVIGQTLVVCTSGYPVGMTGTHPAFMTSNSLNNLEPCISRGSIISAPEGVYYASLNGLVRVANGQAQNVTKDLVTRDRWQQLTRTTNFRAARLSNAYYAFGSVRPGVFEETAFDDEAFTQEDFAGAYLGVMIDLDNPRVAFNMLTSDDPMNDVMNDPWSGEIFLIRDGKVHWLDQTDPASVLQPYVWKSKKFQTLSKKNIGAMKVYFEIPDNIDVEDYGLIRVYADDVEVYSRALVTPGELFRLPSGFKADYWQFQIEAQVKVLQVLMASTPKELRGT